MVQDTVRTQTRSEVLRWLGLAYGLSALPLSLAVWAYWAVFLGNLPPREIPWIEPTVSVGPALAPLPALAVDLGLIILFGLQHSLMARGGVKDWMSRFIAPGLERATYVHASNVIFFLLLVAWQPVPITIWDAGDGPLEDAIWVVYALGWGGLISSLVAIDAAELLGSRQAWAWFRGRPHEPLPLKVRWPYSRVRHPLYLGVLIICWAVPYMTVGHLLFAAGFTAYVAIGIRYEERDLIASGGESYRAYRRAVPALLPKLWK